MGTAGLFDNRDFVLASVLAILVVAISVRPTYVAGRIGRESYISVEHRQPAHRIFLHDAHSAIPQDVREVLAGLEANGLTTLFHPNNDHAGRDNRRGYRNTSSSFAVVRDVLSTVFPTDAGDDKTNLVMVLSGSNSMLLLLVPGTGDAPIALEEAFEAADAANTTLKVKCAGRAASEAVALLLRMKASARGKGVNATAETIAETHESVRDALSDPVERVVVALWGVPHALKALVSPSNDPVDPVARSGHTGQHSGGGSPHVNNGGVLSIRCLSYASIGDSASIATLSGVGMLVSDVDVLNFLPDARIGRDGRDRVLSLFTCPVGIFSGPQPNDGAAILVGAFRAIASSEGGAEHVVMTNFLLTQADIGMADGIEDELQEENRRLGIAESGTLTETFEDSVSRSSPPQAFRCGTPLPLRLVSSELLFERGSESERLRRFVALPDARHHRWAEYLRAGDVLVLSGQSDARLNGAYYVEALRPRLRIATHKEIIGVADVAVDLQTREASLRLDDADGHSTLWYAGSPCVVRPSTGTGGGSAGSGYIVCRAVRVSAGVLYLHIVSAQPYDRESDLDATAEHTAFGDGFTCFPVLLNDGVGGGAPSRASCGARGGVWDRPCEADEDCPFFESEGGAGGGSAPRGGCNVASGGVCEMPLGVNRVGFRRFEGHPLLDPPAFAFDRLLKK